MRKYFVSLHRVFHSIRFKVNKVWVTAVTLFCYKAENMVYVYLTIGLLAVVGLLSLYQRLRKTKNDYSLWADAVHQEQDCFAFLIDKDFNVKETNFYELNEFVKDDQPYVLGNVLHCQNGCDSGLCGTGIACETCPIRLIIRNSFRQKRDFNSVEATMSLYDANHEAQQVNVKVDGKLVYIGRKPHLVVSVFSLSS